MEVWVKENFLFCAANVRVKKKRRGRRSQGEHASPGVMRVFRDWWGPLLNLRFNKCYIHDPPPPPFL